MTRGLVETKELQSALMDFLPRQRWFGAPADDLQRVICFQMDCLDDQLPALLRVELEAVFEGGRGVRYQVLVALRDLDDPAGLPGDRQAAMGELETALGRCRAYDALIDPELAIKLFNLIAPEHEKPANYARLSGAGQSNATIVFDDRVVLKVFRKLGDGPNREVETISGLSAAGFSHIPALIALWRSAGTDLGIMQRFLAEGAEGWALAVGSLRDYYERGGDPSEAGADFASEAERLGEATAHLHAAMSRAFGSAPGDPAAWSDLMLEQLERVEHPELGEESARRVFEDLRDLDDAGVQIRIHGDYHLGQVMRTDAGWFFSDFEGEQARPAYQRAMPSSPLKDVAGMLRSFHYAAWSTMLENDEKPVDLARGWVQRNRQAFLEGYVAVAHLEGGILPAELHSMEAVLRAFELDKTVYDVGYEISHRPDWIEVPLASLGRLC